jgi:hypothetical protein
VGVKFLSSSRQLLLPLSLILLSLSSMPLIIPSVKATGMLYLSPPVQEAQPAGTTITYQVKVANMPAFSSWDILVKVNQTALNPVKIDISGNVLTKNYSLSVKEFVNCANGSGTGCGFYDNPGVVHSAVAAAGAPPADSLISGVLFTITFSAGSASVSSILLFNYDLSLSGSGIPHSAYSTTNAIYGNGKLPIVDFNWTPLFPFVGDNVTFDASASSDPNPKAGITSYLWDFQDPTGSPPASSNPIQHHIFGNCLVGCANPNGNQSRIFAVTLTVTDNLTISNSKTVIIAVNPRSNFTIFVGFSGFAEAVQGMSAKANVSLSSEFGFSGEVTLFANIFPEIGQVTLPTVSLNPMQVELKPGGVNSSVLTVNTSSATSPGVYDLTVVGTSGSSSASASTTFRVVTKDFGMLIFPDQLSVARGSTGSAFVMVGSLFSFSGTVSLKVDKIICLGSSFGGLTASLGTSSVVLLPNSTVGLILTVSTTGRASIGSCDIFLAGTSGTLTHSESLQVEGLVPAVS